MDTVTTMTDFHMEVIDLLERLGIRLQYEVPFPPYQADIYIPSAHAVVEADGPHHTEKRDRERDEVLSVTYKLHVFHVRQSDWKAAGGKGVIRVALGEFIRNARRDAPERFNEVKDRIPWL